MKKSILKLGVLILLLNSGNVFSQANEYLLHNPVWNVHSTCGILYPCVRYEITNYFTAGDTTIDGYVYKQIFKKGVGNIQWFAPPPVDPSCMLGNYAYGSITANVYLRSDGKQMYLRQALDSLEYLLYNFNLNVGDTVPLSYVNNATDVVVTGVDSFYTAYGYRDIFTITGSTWSQTLIEGVGHSNGFLESINVGFDCGFTLDCFSLNDTSYYPTIGLNCDISSGIPEADQSPVLTLNPNPFREKTILQINNVSSPVEVSILNNLGALIKSKWTNETGYLEIDNKKMAPGMYYLSFKKNETASYLKLVLLKE